MTTAKPSIYTVAEHAGVSIATVSRVLRGTAPVAPATRERVLAATEALRWRPSHVARGLAGKGHSAIGVVFPDLLGPYYAQVVLGFEQHAVADDRSVLILATHGRPNADEMVVDLAGRVDGLVVMDRTVSDEVVRGLDKAGTPIVLLARDGVGSIPVVRAENIEAAKRLTSHLMDHGHTRLAFVGDPEGAPDVEQRWRGFLAAHEAAGVSPPEKAIRCGFLTDDGYACGSELLDDDERPTAVVCANDELALGLYRAARDLGLRIPADVAVTGWDDLATVSLITPALTTVRQPARELGARAGALLSARIAGSDDLIPETLPTDLVLRHSCGCQTPPLQPPTLARRAPR